MSLQRYFIRLDGRTYMVWAHSYDRAVAKLEAKQVPR